MEVDREILPIEHLTAQRHLEPGILYGAEVLVLSRCARADRRRDDRRDEGVMRQLRVVRDVELDAIAEQSRIEPAFPFDGTLWSQAVVAGRLELFDWRVAVLDAR